MIWQSYPAWTFLLLLRSASLNFANFAVAVETIGFVQHTFESLLAISCVEIRDSVLLVAKPLSYSSFGLCSSHYIPAGYSFWDNYDACLKDDGNIEWKSFSCFREALSSRLYGYDRFYWTSNGEYYCGNVIIFPFTSTKIISMLCIYQGRDKTPSFIPSHLSFPYSLPSFTLSLPTFSLRPSLPVNGLLLYYLKTNPSYWKSLLYYIFNVIFFNVTYIWLVALGTMILQ